MVVEQMMSVTLSQTAFLQVGSRTLGPHRSLPEDGWAVGMAETRKKSIEGESVRGEKIDVVGNASTRRFRIFVGVKVDRVFSKVCMAVAGR